MDTALKVEPCSFLRKMLSDVLKLKKLNFAAVKIPGSQTEPANSALV